MKTSMICRDTFESIEEPHLMPSTLQVDEVAADQMASFHGMLGT